MTNEFSLTALIITSGLAFVTALTTVIPLYFWPKCEKRLIAKDLILAAVFAVTEPFSYYGHSEWDVFANHILLALIVYLIAKRSIIKFLRLDVWKVRVPHH